MINPGLPPNAIFSPHFSVLLGWQVERI